MKHVVIDIETLGTSPGCVVLQIGIASLTDEGIKSGKCFNVDKIEQQRLGLKQNMSTLIWWEEQSPRAKNLVLNAPPDGGIEDAWKFVKDACENADGVWGFSASFDLGCLAAMFAAVGLEKPWNYKTERCLRTVLALAGTKSPIKWPKTTHVAFEDAVFEAGWLLAFLKSNLAGCLPENS